MSGHIRNIRSAPAGSAARWCQVALACAALVGPGMAAGQAGQPREVQSPKERMDHENIKGMDHGDMKGMDHENIKGMDHGNMKGMDHGNMKGMDHGNMKGMDHGNMKGMDHRQAPASEHGAMDMDMGSMQGGSAPPGARDPDAFADGLKHGPMPGMDMADNDHYARLMLNKLEATRSSKHVNGQSVDAQAWFGGDVDKLWLKLESEREGGRLGATRSEVLWDHAIAPYWSLQTGLRHDHGDGASRNWAAFGVQGLAPYWFEVEATAYVGSGGRTAARLEADYDLLLTQRLVLQPSAELNVYGRSDRERGIGSGLSDIELGLRLRYEVTRKVAPYIGVVWSRKFGRTASYAREAGEPVRKTQFVAGLRLWF